MTKAVRKLARHFVCEGLEMKRRWTKRRAQMIAFVGRSKVARAARRRGMEMILDG